MASSSEEGDAIQEEREEVMVSPTGGIPTPRAAHFLRPTVPSTECIPEGSLPSKPTISDSKKTPRKVKLFERRCAPEKWRTWVDHLLPLYQHIWKKAGVYEAILGSTYDIRRDNDLVIGVIERWSVKTNTFIFPWGEATVSLEDVMVLGGYSVLGHSISTPLETEESIEVEMNLRKAQREVRSIEATRTVSSHPWMDHFMGGTNTQLEHEAFLALWLSRFVLVNSRIDYIRTNVFPIAIHLSRGTPLALAPVVLARLYRDLSSLKTSMIALDEGLELTLRSPFQLVQLWAWERFPALRPWPNVAKCGEPRVARWHRLSRAKVGDVRLAIDSSGECFQWRPYATFVKNVVLSKIYREEEEWVVVESCMDKEIESFARCLRVCELVGLDCIEQYLPHRVAMQFGFDQDLPGYFERCTESPEAAWRNYNRPLKDSKLYIPARLFESDVTTRYAKWWKQFMTGKEDAIKGVIRKSRSSNFKRKEFVSGKEDAIKGVIRKRRSSNFKSLPRASWGNKFPIVAPPPLLVVEDGGCAEIEQLINPFEELRCEKKRRNVKDGLASDADMGTHFQSSPSTETKMPSSLSLGGPKTVLEDTNTVKASNLKFGNGKNEEETISYGENEIPVSDSELESRISKLEKLVAELKATKFGTEVGK